MKLWGVFLPLFFTLTAWCQQDSSRNVVVTVDTLANRVFEIGRIVIIGNKVTKEPIITRELSLHPGDTVSSRNIADVLISDRSKIYNLRLFQTVVVRTLPAGGDRIDLVIEVTERWYTFPQPIFELSDRNFNEWWRNYGHDLKRVNYGIRLYRNNFRGRNEYIRVMAQFGYVRRFGLLYRVPNLGKTQKHGLAFNIDYGEPKNLAYKTVEHVQVFEEETSTLKKSLGLSSSYSYRRSFYETHSVSLEFHRSIISDTIRNKNENYFSEGANEQMYTGISYGFNSEHRDVVAYPLKGYHFSGFISKIGLGLGDDVNQLEANVTVSQHYPLGRNFFLSNFTSGYASTPYTQPYSNFSALGYRRQFIRGYETYLIEGPNFVLNKTTLKKRLFSRAWSMEDSPIEQFRHFPLAIYLKVYFDFGYVQNYPGYNLGDDFRLADKWLNGAGIGLDVVTLYDNVFRFEYTLSREGITGFFFNVRKEF